MSTPDEYRRKAEQCRRLKLMALSDTVHDLLDQMAREFDEKAAAAMPSHRRRSAVSAAPSPARTFR